MHPRDEYENQFMAALYGYFDESGKHHQQKVVVFSGFLTTLRAWERFGDEWNILLRQKNLEAIHFKDHKRRTSLMKQCISAIKTHIELGIFIAVKVSAFNGLPEHVRQNVGGNAGYFAFRAAVLGMTRHARAGDGNVIHFTCDEDEETTLQCYRWYKDVKRDIPGMKKCLVSFGVADDLFVPQLQASDVFAGLVRQEADRRWLGVESETEDLFKYMEMPEPNTKLKFSGLFLDENHFPRLTADFEEALAETLIGDSDKLSS